MKIKNHFSNPFIISVFELFPPLLTRGTIEEERLKTWRGFILRVTCISHHCWSPQSRRLHLTILRWLRKYLRNNAVWEMTKTNSLPNKRQKSINKCRYLYWYLMANNHTFMWVRVFLLIICFASTDYDVCTISIYWCFICQFTVNNFCDVKEDFCWISAVGWSLSIKLLSPADAQPNPTALTFPCYFRFLTIRLFSLVRPHIFLI